MKRDLYCMLTECEAFSPVVRIGCTIRRRVLPPFRSGGDTLAWGRGGGRTQFGQGDRHCDTLRICHNNTWGPYPKWRKKTFRSSLNIFPEACYIKKGMGPSTNASPSYFLDDPWIISIKENIRVTAILLTPGASLKYQYKRQEHYVTSNAIFL